MAQGNKGTSHGIFAGKRRRLISCYIFGFTLDQDAIKAPATAADARRSGTCERIQDRAPWWRNQLSEPRHRAHRLDGRMLAAGAIGFAGLRAVEKPGCGTGIAARLGISRPVTDRAINCIVRRRAVISEP